MNGLLQTSAGLDGAGVVLKEDGHATNDRMTRCCMGGREEGRACYIRASSKMVHGRLTEEGRACY